MPLSDPTIDKPYWFVRIRDRTPDWASFIRFRDDSALTKSAHFETIFENDDEIWRQAIDSLLNDGFVLQYDARSSGLISSHDEPPSFD